MKILITGANGLTGKELTKKLKHHDVTSLGQQDLDVRDYKTFPKGDFDCVIHLAALSRGEEDKNIIETNVTGTLNVLKFCKEKKAKLIFLSSYAVYGWVDSPANETTRKKPRSLQAFTKSWGENLCKLYHNLHGVEVIVIRSGNIYGEGQGSNYLIPKIISQKNDSIIKLTNKYQKRDYIHVKDLVRAVEKLINFPGTRTINIGSGKSKCVHEIASIISNKPQRFKLFNLREDLLIDIKYARKVLNWQPEISLKDGLEELK